MRSLLFTLAIVTSGAAIGKDFSECHEFSTTIQQSKSAPVISEEGLRADWVIGDRQIGCRIDNQKKVVSIITKNGELSRAELLEIQAMKKSNIAFSPQGDEVLLDYAKDWLSNTLKDPSSARFERVYIAAGPRPVVCGEVNAKNSLGGYTGLRRFYFSGKSSINAIEDAKYDEVFINMHNRMCAEKRKSVHFSLQTEKQGVSVADELQKLHGLLKQGLLSQAEFNEQRQRLLR